MTPPSYTYSNSRFTEDDGQVHHSPGPSVSPPPPYHVVVAERLRRASASHSQGQSPPILTAFRMHQHGTQTQGHGHIASVSPDSAYAAVMASGMAGVEGLVYHHLVQVPYSETGYPPPVPSGFPPSSPPPPPVAALSSHQASAHLVPQPLPTHTGRDPGPAPSPSIQPNPPVPTHQPTLTSTSTATATNCTEPSWTPEQDRLLVRLHKDERKSHPDISAALEDVFQVKRDADAVKKRLAQLRARSKVWSEDKLKQAAQKAMQSFSSVMQGELANSFNFNSTGSTRNSINDGNNEQSVEVRLAVRLEMEKMLAQGNFTRTMQERMVSEQKERSARHRTAMGLMERGREWVSGDGDGNGDESRDQVEDYEIV